MRLLRCMKCGILTMPTAASYHYRSSAPMCPRCRHLSDEAEAAQRELRLAAGAAQLDSVMRALGAAQFER